MPRTGLRFRPPAVEMSPAIRWMLVRAFGPVGAAAPAAGGEEALGLCRLFELSARVAARQGRARLQAEIGEAAAGFARDQALAVAGGMRLMALGGRVAAAAAALDLPLVFLKFAGLELSGLLAPGSRAACDLDVLAPAGRAGELQRALIAGGFRPSGLPPPEQQLAALAGAEGIVEVHRVLLGVRIAGERSATLADLVRAGLLVPVTLLPGDAAGTEEAGTRDDHLGRLAPDDDEARLARDVNEGGFATDGHADGLATLAPVAAVAHALVHGIAQHGWSPLAYSLFKMFGDLVDLGFGGAAGAALGAAAGPWVAGELTAGELAAARGLCAALAAGDDLGGWGDSPAVEAALLRHALAGRLQPPYERALKLGLFRRQPSDHAEAGRLARSLLATLWLSRDQVDAIYGPPRHRLGYLARQLARPFDLLARLGRYGGRALALRRRRGSAGLNSSGR
jgi:hypothetical protein